MNPDLGLLALPRGAVDIEVVGERVQLLPQRAAFWAAQRTLIVADLHVGKEETFLESGIPMPRAVLDETMARLDALVALTAAVRIVVVGDLVHARRGLTAHVIDCFAQWRRGFDGALELALGNHDARIEWPNSWGLRVRDDDERDGPFAYSHEPSEKPRRGPFVWCGHLHPTVRLESHIASLVLPCFAIGSRQAILPAFTAFSRGLSVSASEHRLFAIADGEVVEVRSDAN